MMGYSSWRRHGDVMMGWGIVRRWCLLIVGLILWEILMVLGVISSIPAYHIELLVLCWLVL